MNMLHLCPLLPWQESHTRVRQEECAGSVWCSSTCLKLQPGMFCWCFAPVRACVCRHVCAHMPHTNTAACASEPSISSHFSGGFSRGHSAMCLELEDMCYRKSQAQHTARAGGRGYGFQACPPVMPGKQTHKSVPVTQLHVPRLFICLTVTALCLFRSASECVGGCACLPQQNGLRSRVSPATRAGYVCTCQ